MGYIKEVQIEQAHAFQFLRRFDAVRRANSIREAVYWSEGFLMLFERLILNCNIHVTDDLYLHRKKTFV